VKPTKEYTGRSTIRMYNCDCMELLNSGKRWDLAIVDPPYGIGDFRDAGNTRIGQTYVRDKYKEVEWNESPPSKDYFDALYKCTENRIIWGCQYYVGMIKDVGRIVHDKDVSMTTISQADIASCSMQKRVSVYKYTWHGFRRGNSEKYDSERIHPCEKPVSLYKWLLKNYGKDGDVILDTYGGSMSLAIACWDLGFDLDICELDTDYFNDAVKRFENHISQTQIF
jgi:site-specific DNA-methyltransferase (adenine-specific)